MDKFVDFLVLLGEAILIIIMGVLFLAFLPILLIMKVIFFIHDKRKEKKLMPTEAEKACPYYIDVEAN